VRTTTLVLTGLPGSDAAAVAAAITTPGRRAEVPAEAVDDIDELRRRLDGGAAALAVDPALLDDPGSRAMLRSRARVVWLDATDEDLARRALAGSDPARRHLPGGADVSAAEIRRRRRRWLAPLTVAADAIVTLPTGRTRSGAGPGPAEPPPPSAAAAAVAERLAQRDGAPDRLVERVELDGGRGYPVVVGRGVLDELPDHLPPRSRRVAVVTQAAIGVEVATGRDQEVFLVDDGEGAKRLDEVGRLASAFARWGMTRADCVVSVGGGVVSDLAGFVAASYHRGIPVVHVPTTLLGQIDAAIGGKCGVNLPEGKNLVGAFWQPEAVLCDVDTLATLPPREFRAGMGELAKYHFLGGGRLDRLELVERVARCVAIKADVVSGDEREGGRRAVLNYGHTLAHALETLGDYDRIRHGEAVAIGLVYAAELARAMDRIDRARVDEHRRVVSAYGLDTDLPPGLDHDQVIDLFARDKKAVDGVTFVLDGPRGVETVPVGDRRLLAAALEAVAAAGPSSPEASVTAGIGDR
jgi:5-deoxy-5-amino-3-dehydroquinate synthase